MLSGAVLIYCILLMLIQAIREIKKHGFEVFDPKYIFEAYYIVQLPFSNWVADVYHVGIIDDRMVYTVSSSLRQRVSILIMLGFTFFVFGSYLGRRAKAKPWKITIKMWNVRTADVVFRVLIVFGYFCFFILMRSSGGIRTFLTNIQSFRNTGLVGNGILFFPCTTLFQMALLIYVFKEQQKNKFKIWKYLIVLLFCVLPSFFLGFRGFIFTLLLQNVVVYHLFIHRFPLQKICVIIILLLVLFSGIGIYREYGNINQETLSEVTKNRPDLLFGALLRSRGSEILAKVMMDLDATNDYQLGYRSVIEAITIIIPHAVWANKPEAKSVMFSETFFGLNGGVSPTILAELYWDFGYIGALIGMMVTGFLISLIFKKVKCVFCYASARLLFAHLYTTSFNICEAISGTINGLVLYSVSYFIIIKIISHVSVGRKQREIIDVGLLLK